MPLHDPVPTRPASIQPAPPAPIPARRDPGESERAWLRYKRMMKWMALASLLAVLAALLYLKLTGAPMPISLVIATSAGVGLSVLLAAALMGLVFLSDSAGHDEAAAGRKDRGLDL